MDKSEGKYISKSVLCKEKVKIGNQICLAHTFICSSIHSIIRSLVLSRLVDVLACFPQLSRCVGNLQFLALDRQSFKARAVDRVKG